MTTTENTLTRRALLAGAGTTIASAALAVPLVNAALADEVCSLPMDPMARYEAAVAELKAAALAIYPDIESWTTQCTDDYGVLIFGCRPDRPVEFSGPGVYEIKMTHDAGGVTCPVVALAAPESGAGYYWQHYFLANDQFEGEVEFIASARLTIKRKIKSLA